MTQASTNHWLKDSTQTLRTNVLCLQRKRSDGNPRLHQIDQGLNCCGCRLITYCLSIAQCRSCMAEYDLAAIGLMDAALNLLNRDRAPDWSTVQARHGVHIGAKAGCQTNSPSLQPRHVRGFELTKAVSNKPPAGNCLQHLQRLNVLKLFLGMALYRCAAYVPTCLIAGHIKTPPVTG